MQKIKIPNFNEKVEDLSPDQIRSRMKEQGLLPPRTWQERPIFISATGSVFEPYVPPEGDGKLSALSVGVSNLSLIMCIFALIDFYFFYVIPGSKAKC